MWWYICRVNLCEDTDGDGLGNPGSETTECVDGGRDVTDGCDLPDFNLFLGANGEVFYNSSEAIGGFQFNVDGATVSAASGGDAGAAGFAASPGGNTVLGFSFTGATFGPGCGILTNLALMVMLPAYLVYYPVQLVQVFHLCTTYLKLVQI